MSSCGQMWWSGVAPHKRLCFISVFRVECKVNDLQCQWTMNQHFILKPSRNYRQPTTIFNAIINLWFSQSGQIRKEEWCSFDRAKEKGKWYFLMLWTLSNNAEFKWPFIVCWAFPRIKHKIIKMAMLATRPDISEWEPNVIVPYGVWKVN